MDPKKGPRPETRNLEKLNKSRIRNSDVSKHVCDFIARPTNAGDGPSNMLSKTEDVLFDDILGSSGST